MAKLYISSKEDKAKAQRLEAAIDNGDLPRPPAGTQSRNVCEICHAATVLRYYIRAHGWCCGACFDDYRIAPGWCNTRADQVHRGRFHIVPQCVIDAESASNTPVVDRDVQLVHQSHGDELVQRAVENLGKQQDARHAAEALSQSWVGKQVASIKAHREVESLASEQRWHAARRAGEARRGAAISRLP